MTAPRRRVLRRSRPVPDSRILARLDRSRGLLAREREILNRWRVKLSRAFHTVEKQERRIARLEKRLGEHGNKETP